MLAAEWERGQDAIKAEEIEITYSGGTPSASDGKKGHRHTVTVKRDFSIELVHRRRPPPAAGAALLVEDGR